MPLPVSLNYNTPAALDSPEFGDDHLRNIQDFIISVFGMSNNTSYTTAAFTITSTGSASINVTGLAVVDINIQSGTLSPSSQRPFTLGATWNDSATTFEAMRISITDTTSSVNARFLALRLTGAQVFAIRKDGAVVTGTWSATPVTELFGGTAQSSYTTGSILYASATNTLSKLAAPSTNSVLTCSTSSTDLQWSTFSITDPAVTTIRLGATPSGTGSIRMSNNTNINARNSANNANITMMGLSTNNTVVLGQATATMQFATTKIVGSSSSASWGATPPAISGAVINTWIPIWLSDGTTAYLPAAV